MTSTISLVIADHMTTFYPPTAPGSEFSQTLGCSPTEYSQALVDLGVSPSLFELRPYEGKLTLVDPLFESIAAEDHMAHIYSPPMPEIKYSMALSGSSSLFELGR